MQNFHSPHNANLLNTVPESRPIVNCVSSIVGKPVIDYIERYEGDSAWYKVDYAPGKLFVKVTNSIYDYQLHPRLLEFYCNMSYLCNSFPNAELPILTIQELIIQFTGININKNSINTYLNDLIDLGLIKRSGKFYQMHEPASIAEKANTFKESICKTSKGDVCKTSLSKEVAVSEPPSGSLNFISEMKFKGDPDGGCIKIKIQQPSLHTTDNQYHQESFNNLRPSGTSLGKEVLNGTQTNTKNYYYNPKKNWTPFYITIYNTDTKKGSMAVEMYLASKPYNLHHPDKVCKDLNISRKTYYTYLKDLITKGIVKRHKLTYKCYHYTNDYRIILWKDYESVMESRYELNNMNWKELREKRKTKPKAAHSRQWFISPMARVMKDYGINYIKAFDNYDPNDAYLIVKELEDQYRCSGGKLNAAIIVRAILDAWNWTKIQDRIHAKRKRLEVKENNKRIDSRYYMEYV